MLLVVMGVGLVVEGWLGGGGALVEHHVVVSGGGRGQQ